MDFETAFVFILINLIEFISGNVNISVIQTKEFKPDYNGENFPPKYLEPEEAVPTVWDLDYYLSGLERTVDNFALAPNSTNVNQAAGLFFMKAMLKRSLKDDGSKLNRYHRDILKDIMRKAENILSHYIYLNTFYGNEEAEYKVARLFKDDTALSSTMRSFNKHRLREWILSQSNMHDYLLEMDDMTLPKEKYAHLVESMSQYHISAADSGTF